MPILTIKNLIVALLDNNFILIESETRLSELMRFRSHTGSRKSVIELNHERKQKMEFINLINLANFHLSNWDNIIILAESKTTPIYLDRNEENEVANNLPMAKEQKNTFCPSTERLSENNTPGSKQSIHISFLRRSRPKKVRK